MTNDESNLNEADAANRCSLYLLGEGSDIDRESFEKQLATVPGLADELVRQADLLLTIADARTVLSPSPPFPTISIPTTPIAEQPITETRRPLVAMALAIAACFALVVFGLSFRDRDSGEELLIAQAWADNLVDGTSESVVGLPDTGTDSDANLDANLDTNLDTKIDTETADGNEGGPGDELSFDWMFAAVSLDSDATRSIPSTTISTQTETSNEG